MRKNCWNAPLLITVIAICSACAAVQNATNTPEHTALAPSANAPPSHTNALAPHPPTSAFIEERAQQAYATGRWDVAEGYYQQLLRLKPKDAQVWFELGNLYAEQGRLDSAQRAYRESLRRRDDPRTLHNLGLVQIKLGVGALREAQQRLPANDPARQDTRELLQTLLESLLLPGQAHE